jgi:hypothetical protein
MCQHYQVGLPLFPVLLKKCSALYHTQSCGLHKHVPTEYVREVLPNVPNRLH